MYRNSDRNALEIRGNQVGDSLAIVLSECAAASAQLREGDVLKIVAEGRDLRFVHLAGVNVAEAISSIRPSSAPSRWPSKSNAPAPRPEGFRQRIWWSIRELWGDFVSDPKIAFPGDEHAQKTILRR